MSKPEIEALLERVKAATGPDQELDEAIWLATIPDASRKNVMAKWPDQKPIWEYSDPDRNLIGRSLVPRLTASTDAALVYSKRSLGDNWFIATLDAMREFGAAGTLGPEHLPRFIIAATLTAIRNRGTEND